MLSKKLLGLFASLCVVGVVSGCGGDGKKDEVSTVDIRQVTLGASLPFNATTLTLANLGYVEQEFYVDGVANRYRIRDPLASAEIIDRSNPYSSRVIVRRPTDPSKFNGTVLVEWLNVTTGQDVDFVFGATRESLLRDGYAWVGVSAQRAGIEKLKQLNPERYGKLSVAASNIDPATGGQIDPAQGVAIGGDVLAWDIFSQIGAAVAASNRTLLGDLAVKRVFATGESQSASRVAAYYNAIAPLGSVYQGYLLYDRGGRVRSDTGVKLIAVGSEFGNTVNGTPPDDTANHRWWEIAGASHVSLQEVAYLDPIIKRDGGLRDSGGTPLSLTEAVSGSVCQANPIWSRVPNGDVVTAALKALQVWVTGGPAPASISRLVMNGAQIARDGDGRVSGGIRLPAYDAPIATNVGVNAGGGFCVLAGYHHDYTTEQLCARYGSAKSYLEKVTEQALAAQALGVLVPEDAKRTITEAASVTFTCPAS